MRSGTNNRIKKSVGLGRKKLSPLVQKLCGLQPKRSCLLPRYK
uniref:ORF42b n=1 Tax=Pinus koraiensis TaxID=88728 RepID=A4QML1_PINKO|nr:ORF42b [Pinus koraiensis]ABP35378.1 ORF42b [Pinus koraiensis]